jgi:hypothetical protein
MKDSLINAFIGFLWGFVLCALLSWVMGRTPKSDVTVDTVTDTIVYHEPVARDSIVVRYKTIAVPRTITDTVYPDGDTVYLTRVDSVDIDLPITQKTYRDSMYTAWVSGYLAKLDSIKVASRTIYINKVKKRKRIGVGMQVGYGLTGDRLTPYVGVGVTYDLFRVK